uniref:Uncharacterized protein n=1 Tax=Anguilla anguilla TaxID=7936 RepID=A0A0E9X6F6_ANGAN
MQVCLFIKTAYGLQGRVEINSYTMHPIWAFITVILSAMSVKKVSVSMPGMDHWGYFMMQNTNAYPPSRREQNQTKIISHHWILTHKAKIRPHIMIIVFTRDSSV